jgi:gas vesicle protein
MVSQPETLSMDIPWTGVATIVTILAFGGGGSVFLFNVLRNDLKEGQTNSKADLKEVVTNLKAELKEGQTNLKADLKADLKQELKEVRSEFKDKIDAAEQKVEGHFRNAASAQRKVAKKFRKAFEDDDE